MKVLIDGKIKEQENIKLNLFSKYLHQGIGLKQSILYHKGQLLWYEDHIKKMEETIQFCRFVVDFNHLDQEKIYSLIGYNGLKEKDALIKILCLPDIKQCRTIVLAMEYKFPPIETSATIHNEPITSVLNKYCTINNKGKSFWQEHYAMKNNTEQVLFINTKGRIIQGIDSNIMALWNKNLYYVYDTQPYYEYIIQREILRNASKLGIKKILDKGKGLSIELLERADEVMLINDVFMAKSVREIITHTGRKILVSEKDFAKKIRNFFLNN